MNRKKSSLKKFRKQNICNFSMNRDDLFFLINPVDAAAPFP
ncbi:hypothetical protein SAMN04488128_102382 [Chitinophaga eiseniae]|uniref:Uncharacterized protein n=1 Tax=Chitinophaga eiseniae TaxID=634771 RepID=A0A1T4QHW4_9BACT|nr:hypothetical protein SAMN04488128_102382 [Chitinophaga eiseniae]